MRRAPARLSSITLLALAFGLIPACDCGSPYATTSTTGRHTTTSAGAGTSATSGAGSSGATGTSGAGGSSGCGLVTCTSAKASCGPLGDGCGNVINCGDCPPDQSCGGGGVPFQCGAGGAVVPPTSTTSSSGGACTLCPFQVTCSDGGTTSLSGTVFAPTNPANGFGDPDPLPGATVYVANNPPDAFETHITCDVCGAPISGNPLVFTTSMEDGGFVLNDVPVTDGGFSLVVQLGRWRRVVSIPPLTACTNTVLTADQTRLPRNQAEGDIPKVAMVTGDVDSVECVLRKMGVDDKEFTNPDGGGRIQLYLSDGDAGVDMMTNMQNQPGGESVNRDTPAETLLTTDPNALKTYDLVIFACVGTEIDRSPTELANIVDYANAGGRVYATHYSYVWLFNDPTFDVTADWATAQETSDDNTEQIDVNTGFSKGLELADWLQIVGASTTPDVIPLAHLRNDFTGVNAPSQNWLSFQPGGGRVPPPAWPIHYTFNTPLDPDGGPECGRVVFSDFHVENQNNTYGETFPNVCDNTPMSAQEKVLEFMLFDISSCVTQCPALTCADLGYTCGAAGDGCGDVINCGVCDAGTCGGAFVANQCGSPSFE